MTQQPATKRGFRQKFAETIYRPPRIEEGFKRLRKEAGFIPIFNIEDVEARRQEVRRILEKSKLALFDRAQQKEIAQETFALFFSAGNPWYRGLDNRELSEKVACFLENYTEIGDMGEFIPDLFEESMQLLSLSWQALDVTKTPTYIIESQVQESSSPPLTFSEWEQIGNDNRERQESKE